MVNNIIVNFEFTVSLKSENDYIDVAASPKIRGKIIKWYENMAPNYNMLNMKIKYLNDDKFSGCYKLKTEDISNLETYKPDIDILVYVDADEDGNYPIDIRGESYLVIGRLVSINGKKYEH